MHHRSRSRIRKASRRANAKATPRTDPVPRARTAAMSTERRPRSPKPRTNIPIAPQLMPAISTRSIPLLLGRFSFISFIYSRILQTFRLFRILRKRTESLCRNRERHDTFSRFLTVAVPKPPNSADSPPPRSCGITIYPLPGIFQSSAQKFFSHRATHTPSAHRQNTQKSRLEKCLHFSSDCNSRYPARRHSAELRGHPQDPPESDLQITSGKLRTI